MRRIIMLIFLVISLVAIVAYSVTIDTLFTSLGISFEDIAALFTSGLDIKTILSTIGLILSALFEIYGIPVVIFLVSFNGLTQASKRDVK